MRRHQRRRLVNHLDVQQDEADAGYGPEISSDKVLVNGALLNLMTLFF